MVSGWSIFASQFAVLWCRIRRRPYVVVVESHDRGPRPRWRRVIKRTIVPRVLKPASAVLVTGALARESGIARGARAERVHVFANTIDVSRFGRAVEDARHQRAEIRASLGVHDSDIVVLTVARLAPEKGVDT